jgi:endonuclease-3
VKTKTPEKTETALLKAVPRKYWVEFNDLLVKFGQRTCRPIRPLCYKCPVVEYCDYQDKNLETKSS